MAQQPQAVNDEINLDDLVPEAGLQEPQPALQAQEIAAPRADAVNAAVNAAPAPAVPPNVEPVSTFLHILSSFAVCTFSLGLLFDFMDLPFTVLTLSSEFAEGVSFMQ